ncbi:LUD domain-containing protein [Trinickia caryophylli]|uniref:L-lactate dehydrogenase complex protein LldG n=1 Tax=Trinickia caryophylli TaxID=28094 RepID=A0A1X7FSU8_TRICW|nr:LUD domain-containing protein [Trinickia caryophylli]PMS11941.1 lactate utilization protein C [Trinickia caryophylli]TRX13982.1 lactate utilization protein C [Trinickia caryophylli]WQE15580.1 LUD domain-containing protein [Trinickia caryophylli]SMF58110.1 L-lactate dehydrogenase complex protein LldG [Trinickia caryophylli]GLU33663.1 hypothetical protein Busp01_35050 [Trinickia caryophylli]
MSRPGARERILGRLRAAAARPATGVSDIDRRIDAHYQAHPAATQAMSTSERVETMRKTLAASHAGVICADAASWPAELAQKLAAAGVRRLLLDTAGEEGAALMKALPPNIEVLRYARPIEAWKGELFDTIDAGFTVARSGIAATGTLILAPDVNSPRTVSLVPPLHVALVHADTLHADLHSAARHEHWSDGMPTNLVLVSGPSKTSDIQQTLAYGAHGPRWMWVVIVTGERADTGALQ